MLLSLDISTSCTGYCIFNEDVLVDIGYIALNKHKGLFEKAAEFKSRLLKIQKAYKIKSVAVEENLQAFRPGLSSAKTLMTLAQFNGVVRWICHESISVPVSAINVNSARKSIGLKINRKSSQTTKEQVYEWVASDNKSRIDDIQIHWPTKILKSGPNKGKLRLCNEVYDMADAYVIGRASKIIEN